MSSSKLERFLARPTHEQSMLGLFAIVHTPLNRSRMLAWFEKAALRDAKGRPIVGPELVKLVKDWRAQGLLTLVGHPEDFGHGFTVDDTLRHPLAARLLAAGKLAPLVELVRREEPLFGRYSYYSDPDRLARELFLSLYLGPNADLERARSFHRPRRDEHPGDLLVRAYGLHVPREQLTQLGTDQVEAYLSFALELATSSLLEVGPGLLEFVRERVDTLDGKVLAAAAQFLTLRGQLELAGVLAKTARGPEGGAARCLLALARGEFAEARLHARDALELTRTKKTRQLKGLSGSLWPWLLLALFTATEDPEAAVVARMQLAVSQKKHLDRHTMLEALNALERFLSKGEAPKWPDEPMFTEGEPDWLALVCWLLVMRFTGTALPGIWTSGTAKARASATEAGFVWLAEELARLNAEPLQGLARMYVAEEPWERALRALEGAIELANGANEPTGTLVHERLVWTLIAEADGSYQLTARLQTRTANGFSSGRQLSWKKLYEADPEAGFLSPDDRRVMRHIQLVRDQGYPGKNTHVLAETAPIALVSHPRVFADHECREPVQVVRGDVRVDVQDRDGDVVVTLDPPACLERAVVCRRDGAGHIHVYALTTEQRIVAQQLSREGLRLPPAARIAAQRVLGKLVSQFSLSSELMLAAPHVEDVASDSRIHLQLRRAGGGLRVRCCVAPLGGVPTFPAGVGSANVLSTRNQPEGPVTLRCERDLPAELHELERLWAGCPTLAQFDSAASELRIEELTRCLDLICELRAYGDSVVVEWPDGQALSIVAERDLKDMKLRLRDEATWLRAEGELVVDSELKLTFRQLLEHTRAGQGRFVALDDGRFVALSEALQRSLDGALAMSRVRNDQLELHPLALFGATSLAEAVLDSDPQIAKRLERAREAETLSPDVPHTFEATLRPYQVEGYTFLSRLAHWGAGACLADDMGLGKTLQTMALLVEHAPRGPSLVVAPTSVCANWFDEARKFAPSLRMVPLRTAAREQTLKDLQPFDVLVCSYGVLQQERERLTSTRFQVVVLDEAQAIKNATTHRAKAAMELVSNVRIALTGTPIENHLGELWSILSFVNPGLLGTAKSFDERFVRPIQRDGDRQAAQLLRRIISPFVLRRRKSEVLDDLPEKTVITLRVEPSPEERALFAALREQAVARMVNSDKPAEARIRLLAELTRMRRAACHPDLVMPAAKLASSKLATLEALLLELRQGGHRVLVFSQFVDYLSIVRARLEAIDISYQYLDGSSSTPSRAASVTAFQAGESDVFLISLKAGGFGLNLTAADYVIHLDPWWNPAVEDQASDRAHRIGQTRPVTIYRLVMEGSIEEKILALHAVKRELADDLLAGTGTGRALGVDELMDLLSEANAELSGTGIAKSAE